MFRSYTFGNAHELGSWHGLAFTGPNAVCGLCIALASPAEVEEN